MARPGKWGRRFGSAAAVSILGLAMLAPASSAQAATAAGCVLTITETDGGAFAIVTVGCSQGTVTAFDLYGDDAWPNPDDFLIKIWGSSSHIVADHLNEDIGARDEIYAKAYYTTPSGTNGTANTNRVDGDFGCVLEPLC
ncbi:hypothetical protein [Nonomuraea sp. NPDC050643]|uniref:hypothetical protein n=1 Tax=Nonomuraea sp. NPDC050643 TaxID=3155660 RepID=UPI0033FA46B0